MLRRMELVDAIFQLLDANADGNLDQNELHRFAMLTGFNGSDCDWAAEYGLLCAQAGLGVERGLDAASFSRLVDDTSACYFTDDELNGVERKLREDYATGGNVHKLKDKARRSNKIRRNQAAQPSPEVAVSSSPSSPSGATPGPSPRALSGRRDVAEQVFRCCDRDGDGRLGIWEALRFAKEAGFCGSRLEWEEEFRLICEDMHADPAEGLDILQFKALAGGKEGSCHCSGEELEQICERLQADTDLHKRTEASLESKRQELIRQVFCACNSSGDGVLSCREMERFAKCTGFQGDEEAWQNEYKLLCLDIGVDSQDGINCPMLGRIVNNTTSQGCYCSSEELESISDRLNEENNARHPPRTAVALEANEANRIRPPRCSDFVEVQEATESLIATPTRPAVIELFQLLDRGGDGLLDEEELYRFASLTRFTGSAQDWSQGYHKVCADRGIDPAGGLDVFQFEDFVTDRSERGCFFSEQDLEMLLYVCSNRVEELRALRRGQLELLCARQGAARPLDFLPVPGPAPPKPATLEPRGAPASGGEVDLRYLSRGELVREVFNACDTDGDARLSEGDLFNFAQVTGFNGPPEAWTTEFLSLCLDTKSDASTGIDITVFERLVNDHSDRGCYCLDEELRSMLPLLRQLREPYPCYPCR